MREGYIFETTDRHFLTKNGFVWYEFSDPKKAWVHPKGTLEHLRAVWEVCNDLKEIPMKVYPAIYSPAEGTKIIGEPFNF